MKSPLRSRKFIAALSLAGLWFAFFAQQLLTDGVPFRRDTLALYLPLRQFLHETLRAGVLPQWYPYEGIGVPFIGQLVTQTFHPLTWLLLPLEPTLALKASILLAYLIALIGGYLFARRLGASRSGAICGAASLAFCGYALSMSDNLPYLLGMATLPWVGFASVGVAWHFGARNAALLAIPLALIVVGGDAQMFVFAPLLIAATIVAVRPTVRAFVLALIGMLLGAGLSGVELAPATALFGDSARMTTGFIFDKGTFWALHPLRLIELFQPRFLPEGHHQEASMMLLGQSFRWATTIFAGSIVLLLVTGAARAKRIAIPFALLAVFALWLALGSHAGAMQILNVIASPITSFRYPEKYLAVFHVALVPLVALGADSALANPKAWGRRFEIAAFVALFLAMVVRSERIAFELASLLPGGAGVELAHEIGSAWSGGLMISAVFLATAGAVLLVPKVQRLAFVLLPAALVVELWSANSSYLPVVPRALINPASSGFAKALAQEKDQPPKRVLSSASARYDTGNDGPSDAAWVSAQMEMLRPDVAGLLHASTIGVSQLPAQAQRVRDVFGALGARASDFGGLFGACHRVVDAPADKPTRADAIAFDEQTGLALVPINCRPQAYLSAAHPVPANSAARSEIADTLATLKTDESVWEGGLAVVPKASTVDWKRYRPGDLELTVVSSDYTALVISEAFAEGWLGTVDDKSVTIHPANGIAMGVEIPPGTHDVKLNYTTPRFDYGQEASELALVLILLMLLYGRGFIVPKQHDYLDIKNEVLHGGMLGKPEGEPYKPDLKPIRMPYVK